MQDAGLVLHRDTRLPWVLPEPIMGKCKEIFTFSFFTGTGSKVSADENFADFFSESQLNTRKIISYVSWRNKLPCTNVLELP